MFTGPNIVTEGLVLALDAGNKKSYPGSGNTWTDLSGNGNNGTLTNMSATPLDSGNGGSLEFDGVNDYIGVASTSNSIGIGGSNPRTISCAIKPTLTNSRATIFSMGDNSTAGNRFQLEVGGWNTSIGQLQVFGYYYSSATVDVTLVANEWTYCTIVVPDIVSVQFSDIIFFINGNSVASQTYGGDGLINTLNTSTIEIGRRIVNNSQQYNGSISFIQIYNRALTPQEVQQNYNATKSRFGLT